jgi:predicted alpha/beta-fold hydrolase
MKFVYALAFAVSSYMFYKYKQKKQRLLLVHSNNRLSKLFHLINRKFFENYKPLLYLLSGHAQTFLLELLTILIRYFKKIFRFFNFKYERENYLLSDGGKIAVDHAIKIHIDALLEKKITKYDKILIIVPGVTSTSDDYYIKSFVEDFVDEFQCIVVNARGLAGIKLDSPFMVSSNCYKDLGEYIQTIAEQNKEKKIFAVGFSFGGYLLSRYLGTSSFNLPPNFLAGCGICYPICPYGIKNGEEKLYGIYSKATCNNMKKVFFNNIDTICSSEIYQQRIGLDKESISKVMNECTLFSEFDRIYTTKILGYNELSEYYEFCKLENHLSNIQVPFLSIFSEDDPIVPINTVPLKILQENPNTISVITQYGGHLGFFGGAVLPQREIDQPIKSFMKTVEILRDTEN